jgi:hypothetical protein
VFILIQSNKLNSDRFVLFLNWISTNHGQNPFLGIVYTLLISGLLFFSFLFNVVGCNNLNFDCSSTAETLKLMIDFCSPKK